MRNLRQTTAAFERNTIAHRVKETLATLREKGTRAEDVAVAMEVSYNTVKNWLVGRRVPKLPTVRRMEQIYGIRIL